VTSDDIDACCPPVSSRPKCETASDVQLGSTIFGLGERGHTQSSVNICIAREGSTAFCVGSETDI